MLTILIGTSLFCLLGSLAGIFSDEKSRAKLFWLGVGAPALFAVALPGAGGLIEKGGRAALFSSAYASELAIPVTCSDADNLTLSKGLKSFFGLEDLRYRVVVGSFKKIDDAKIFAGKVNAEDPTIKAVVGEKAPCSDFYSVIVNNGEFVSPEYAKQIQSKVLKFDSVNGAFLSPKS
jgi:hypothetical protein